MPFYFGFRFFVEVCECFCSFYTFREGIQKKNTTRYTWMHGETKLIYRIFSIKRRGRLLKITILARTFGTLCQIFSNTSIISSPPPGQCWLSRVQHISDILHSFCTSTLFRGSGEKNSVKCFFWGGGGMLSPIFKLLTKSIKKKG